MCRLSWLTLFLVLLARPGLAASHVANASDDGRCHQRKFSGCNELPNVAVRGSVPCPNPEQLWYSFCQARRYLMLVDHGVIRPEHYAAPRTYRLQQLIGSRQGCRSSCAKCRYGCKTGDNNDRAKAESTEASESGKPDDNVESGEATEAPPEPVTEKGDSDKAENNKVAPEAEPGRLPRNVVPTQGLSAVRATTRVPKPTFGHLFR